MLAAAQSRRLTALNGFETFPLVLERANTHAVSSGGVCRSRALRKM
jgi:hypothetical protein